MSSRTLNQYRLFCLTENKYIDIWANTPPNICPHTNSDTIDTNSIVIIDSISSNDVNIVQSIPGFTGEFYRSQGFNLVIPANNIGTKTFSWPFNITLLTFSMQFNTTNVGDTVNLFVAPNTTIGTITQNIIQGDTIINVSPTVLTNIYLGHLITITNGNQKIEMGQCINIDSINNKITCDIPANISIQSNAYVQSSRHVLKDFYINISNVLHTLANKTISGLSLQKNTNSTIFYNNNSNVDKTFTFSIEFLY